MEKVALQITSFTYNANWLSYKTKSAYESNVFWSTSSWPQPHQVLNTKKGN